MSSPARIAIAEIYHTPSVTTRAAAEVISQMIAGFPEDHIILDFAGIEFTTLSFLDQLNHEIRQHTPKVVDMVNMNDDLRGLQQVIERRRSAS